jgi:Leucine-rich repeat (LRR) protein
LDSLNVLWAVANNISDISPISNRTNLEVLNLSYNQISDIGSLSGLNNIFLLYLKSNQIQDISALQYMPKIERYNLQNNLIENIEPLVNNKGLGEGDLLAIYGNPLDSISVNEYIPALIDRGVIVYY